MIEPSYLLIPLRRNYNVLKAQTEGLTHADSLLQPPFRGNCMNWVMGHIVQSRDKMLQLVDEPCVWTPEQIARYERESRPVLDGSDALPFEKIMADLTTAQERLSGWLERATVDDLEVIGKEVIKGGQPTKIGDWLHFLIWHEGYHVGQTEFLRQLTGVNDKVI